MEDAIKDWLWLWLFLMAATVTAVSALMWWLLREEKDAD